MYADDPPEPVLSEPQARAIELLAAGENFTRIAEAVGVDRRTLYRWRWADPEFIAAMNRWRRQLLAEVRDRVLAVGERAAAALASAIDEGDGRLALQTLEKMGFLQCIADGPVDPTRVFGAGPQDTGDRRAAFDALQRARRGMDDGQRDAMGRILALGIVYDNHRAGRPTPADILAMAGLDPAPPDGVVGVPSLASVVIAPDVGIGDACFDDAATPPPDEAPSFAEPLSAAQPPSAENSSHAPRRQDNAALPAASKGRALPFYEKVVVTRATFFAAKAPHAI